MPAKQQGSRRMRCWARFDHRRRSTPRGPRLLSLNSLQATGWRTRYERQGKQHNIRQCIIFVNVGAHGAAPASRCRADKMGAGAPQNCRNLRGKLAPPAAVPMLLSPKRSHIDAVLVQQGLQPGFHAHRGNHQRTSMALLAHPALLSLPAPNLAAWSPPGTAAVLPGALRDSSACPCHSPSGRCGWPAPRRCPAGRGGTAGHKRLEARQWEDRACTNHPGSSQHVVMHAATLGRAAPRLTHRAGDEAHALALLVHHRHTVDLVLRARSGRARRASEG